MTTTHNLGFPRIGAKRELKFALESYWKGESSRDALKALWNKIPAEARATVAKLTVEHLDTLKGVVSKVLEIPGVGEKLKPILDAIITKLAGFSA